MIDFATLQGLTIPEGVVTKIQDGSGNELWSASKPMVVVTLQEDLPTSSSTRYSVYYLNGREGVSLDSAGSYEIPVGTNLIFEMDGASGECYVYLNNEEVKCESNGISYDYTLTTNITISYMTTPFGGYYYITEQ